MQISCLPSTLKLKSLVWRMYESIGRGCGMVSNRQHSRDLLPLPPALPQLIALSLHTTTAAITTITFIFTYIPTSAAKDRSILYFGLNVKLLVVLIVFCSCYFEFQSVTIHRVVIFVIFSVHPNVNSLSSLKYTWSNLLQSIQCIHFFFVFFFCFCLTCLFCTPRVFVSRHW